MTMMMTMMMMMMMMVIANDEHVFGWNKHTVDVDRSIILLNLMAL